MQILKFLRYYKTISLVLDQIHVYYDSFVTHELRNYMYLQNKNFFFSFIKQIIKMRQIRCPGVFQKLHKDGVDLRLLFEKRQGGAKAEDEQVQRQRTGERPEWGRCLFDLRVDDNRR